MRSTHLLALLAFAFAGPTLTARAAAEPAAAAPASDADRAAARELYNRGVELQQKGQYADALDKFQRAQAVVSAPTNLLRIAQCQAGLGKLVAAAETYRLIQRTELAPNAPQPFVDAKKQAANELGALEPRIPMLTLNVQGLPKNPENLSVQIGAEPMNAALIGVARPVNPGEQTIAVTAKGCTRAEEKVVLAERSQRAVTVTVRCDESLVIPPPVPLIILADPKKQPEPQKPPAATEQRPPPPPAYESAKDVEERAARDSFAGFLIGGHAGFIGPGGNLSTGDSVGSYAGGGFGLGGELGFRFAKNILILGGLQGAGFIKSPSAQERFAPTGNVNMEVTNATGLAYGALGFLSNNTGTGFYGEFGVGMRSFITTVRGTAASDSSRFAELKGTYSGTDFVLGAGIHVRPQRGLRVIPKIQGTWGKYSKLKAECTSGGGVTCPNNFDGEIASDKQETHYFVMVGVSIYYNVDFK